MKSIMYHVAVLIVFGAILGNNQIGNNHSYSQSEINYYYSAQAQAADTEGNPPERGGGR
ncbi:hypothetical protein QT972_22715 [Microcoleus sp. herbarium7]|uniref:hypothetical protein n=1 Tax=Microcoleus sp. herbarium7 TaxID=3055435 RepID=UPI002FCEE509